MIKCAISKTYKGDPAFKVTQDAPQVTLDLYTKDLNYIDSLCDTNLVLLTEKEYTTLSKKNNIRITNGKS